ncbi:MAG TPA: TlpA disulfide reductase family protein [Terriglobia bacterium]|nr:TlpA disulfide reductase family protein [Terriglobia bacterium]
MRKITIAKWIVVGLAGLGVLWLVLHPHSRRPVALGDPAPGFSLPRIPSGNLSLADFRGKVVVLNFWATWCPPCVAETPSLEAFAAKVQDRGVVVLSVSVDEDSAVLQKFVEAYHLTYPVARNPNRGVPARYGTFKFPETYIIDRGGRVADKIVGPTDWTDPRMIAFVESLAGGASASGR